MTAQVYNQKHLSSSYDAIVIGSGIGGLATAAFLAKAGKKVLVLERHYVAGGFTHTFSRKGYEWDVGVHYIGEVHREGSVLRKVFDAITDGELKWAKMPEIYDRVVIGDSAEVYDYVAGVKNFAARMKDYFPGEAKAIDGYIQLVFESSSAGKGYFAAKAMPPLAGSLAYPFLSSRYLKYSDKTTLEVLSSLTNNKKLIGVLSAQYGDYGLPPAVSSFAIHAMVAKHYFDGGNYPIGGAGRMADTIIPIIERAGGQVLLRAEIDKIIIEKGKAIGVTLSNGDEIRAPLIISNAGVINTFGKMLPKEWEEKIGVRKKLSQVSPSLAHIGLYLGMKESSAVLNLPKHNYWIYPGYDHDKSIKDYSENPSAPLPVTYVSFPSAKDPSWNDKHPGRSTVEVVGFSPYSWFSKWENEKWMKRGEDYDNLKKQLSDRLMENVYRFVPQLKGKIDYLEVSSPLSTRHFCNYDKGEIYGLDHTPKRFRLKWLKPHTPIKNLFLTGQDIVSVGIGGALMGGALTASAILKKNLIMDVMKERA